ncbi:MAG: type II toxin-antitoxin system RelB/DinJ family antitoxin [Clostridia bacterium]|nr:type II toxin-antitoxin system RelB/DinJ family antitoxin [Oscillospiraceae bacterium]MBO4931969.1 type II toxin-antitoxin system RelB/DinJ family antitoxin [Clostridia bacterium]MBO5127355.1 type II toxin-antitoxin system RelB/DinJ family antitoxin [Clostridia bacterium]MBO5257124.1 type II toxin-antitoxin system RelB/DinJ family antitoxin [Clostridia bacterium]MBP3292310.1 type II toxin-antitoxin system RelB/DinJ family antitoxin [Clostridia bacterium]
MGKALVNIRMDEELKHGMEEVCRELGMDMTTAITIFARKMTREKRIPFEVSIDPFYSERNLRAIDESLEQLRQGKVVVKTLEELEAMENG